MHQVQRIEDAPLIHYLGHTRRQIPNILHWSGYILRFGLIILTSVFLIYMLTCLSSPTASC